MWVGVFVSQNHVLNGRARILNTNVSKLHLKKCEFKEQGNYQIKVSDLPLFYDLASLHRRK